MPDYTLTARPPLGVDPIAREGVDAREVADLSVVSIATPPGGEAALGKAVTAAYGVKLPPIGRGVRSDTDKAHILGLQPGQHFVLFSFAGTQPMKHVGDRLSDTAYLTDQSDSWAMVRISGERSREALERICPLDLDPDVFGIGSVARTVMEHLGVIIVREDDCTFLLMSARSSAASFWHAIEMSIDNIT